MREHKARQGKARQHFPGQRDRAGLRAAPRPREGIAILYGWHTVKAALDNPARRIRRLLATENALRRLSEEGTRPDIKPELVRPDAIAALAGREAVHNGLYAEADP